MGEVVSWSETLDFRRMLAKLEEARAKLSEKELAELLRRMEATAAAPKPDTGEG